MAVYLTCPHCGLPHFDHDQHERACPERGSSLTVAVVVLASLLALMLAGCGPGMGAEVNSDETGGETGWPVETETGGETGGAEAWSTTRGSKPPVQVEACCYCNPGGTWTCDVWQGGAEACTKWGHSEDLTVTWFPDCPAAATDDPLDDIECFANCA